MLSQLSYIVASFTPNHLQHFFPTLLDILHRKTRFNGFGGLEVACWPLVPKFARSHPAEAVWFLGRSKAVGPMS